MLRVGALAPDSALPERRLTGRAVGRVLRSGTHAVAGTRLPWRTWRAALVGLDAFAALVAAAIGVVTRFHGDLALEYVGLVAALPVLWVATMSVVHGYDSRFFGTGVEEYRRIATAGIWLLAALASISFVTHADLSRAAVGLALPLVVGLTLVGRIGARSMLRRAIRRGASLSRVLVVGTPDGIHDVVDHVRRAPEAGLAVVGACVDGDAWPIASNALGVPVLGGVDDVLAAAEAAGADSIAVVGSVLARGELRQLSWRLQGTGMRLVFVPAIAEVAGPRILVRGVNGLPLLHVERPPFTGTARAAKDVAERTLALAMLVVLAPAMACIAIAVRLTSPGPALFRQERVGRDGRPFRMLKFRTMRVGADRELGTLEHLNEGDGPLFKIREDPRLTSIGRWLRRLSLDELPQLLNVLGGTMSLVGPRPPLQSEVDRYAPDDHRRLLVKPGITGLWQVSGRSELSWEESVRLDLFYVDNWSIRFDLLLLWRTVFAVLARRGAY